MSVIRSLVVATFIAFTSTSHAADTNDEKTLATLGVKADREAVAGFLADVVAGKRGALPKEQAAALVADLASRDFAERDKATRVLKEQLFPPVELLEAVAKDGSPEQVRRARQILSSAAARPDPVAAALRLARSKKWAVPLDIAVAVAVVSAAPVAELANDLIADTATTADEKRVREWLADKNPRRVAAAARVLPLVSKADATGEAAKLLGHADHAVRFAAARGLLQKTDSVDFKPYKEPLTAEGYARLIAVTEWEFRAANASNLKDAKAMVRYERIIEQFVPALQACDAYKSEKGQGPGNDEWVKLGLDTSSRPDILLYRVRWFSGMWSNWYTPGFGDVLMDGDKPESRNIRVWACFGDHEYEVIRATRPDQHRNIIDAKQ